MNPSLNRLPLRAALPLAVGTLLLLVACAGLWAAWKEGLQQLDAAAEAVLHDELFRLARHAGDHGNLHPGELAQDIGQIATHPLVRQVALIDHQGRIKQAHRRSWVGRPAAEVIAGWQPQRLDTSLGQRRADVRRDEPALRLSGLLSYLQPVFEATQTRQLEPALVYVQLDLRRAREDLAFATLRNRLPDLLAIGALLALLAGGLQWAVAHPLHALERASRLWADGNLDARASERGPAEIARLAQAFNQMVTALQHGRGELSASKEQLSTVLYSTGDALLATDTDRRITLLNPAAERLTGWREHEARGRRVDEVFRIEHAHTGKPAEIPVQRVLDSGMVVGLANHTVLVSRQGERTHIADSAAPVRDGRGALHGVVLVFRDVSEAYRLEQALADSEHHYRTLANTGHALRWVTDLQGRGNWCNDPWLAFTGQSRDEALAAGWLGAVHPDEFDQALLGWRGAVGAHLDFQQMLRLRRHDGTWRWMHVEAVPRRNPDGRSLGHVLLAVDITREHEIDSRLRAQVDELRRWQGAVLGREERIAELKAEVNTLLARLDQTPRYELPTTAAPRTESRSSPASLTDSLPT